MAFDGIMTAAVTYELNHTLQGGKIEKVDEITLPNTDIQRKIVVIKKIKSTPNKYPRKAGMPLKEPIL